MLKAVVGTVLKLRLLMPIKSMIDLATLTGAVLRCTWNSQNTSNVNDFAIFEQLYDLLHEQLVKIHGGYHMLSMIYDKQIDLS